MLADIIVDLQYGDCGKGKVTHTLLENGDYTHCIRYNGGCNAGHTIYHKGEKFITHHIPAGVFWGVKSIIGPGCVVNLETFYKEIKELESKGVLCNGLVFIAKGAHIITASHLVEDSHESKIGTTKRGNGPAYRDKYARKGVRAETIPHLEPYLVDMYEELHNEKYETIALFEGAQGFGLDIDWGDYPYVTSSHCTTAGAMLNGIPPRSVRHVWGVAKCYETYVGNKEFETASQIFSQIRDVGQEYGATTGRPRQCNWLNIDLLRRAAKINGVTNLVINKMDVLREVGTWTVRDDNGTIENISDEKLFRRFLKSQIPENIAVYFSESPHTI